VEPTFIEVHLSDPAVAGTAAAPLPFSAEAQSFAVTVSTLDVHGDPYPLDATLALDVRPGRISGESSINLSKGVWSGDLAIEAGFGPTRIWAKDADDSGERAPSWAAGVSEAIWYQKPTIAQMQSSSDHETNQLEGEFAELLLADRQVAVTALDAAGFWASDVLDAPGNYSGLYIYTFQKPPDEVVVGAQLSLLGGQDSEYLASTQLSYPTVEVAVGVSLTPPEAVELSATACADDNEMEKLEGSKVRAINPTLPASFTVDSDEYADFVDYGQWPITLGSCTLYAESGSTVPDWYPPDHAGQTLDHVEGMIKEVYGKWIFTILDADGIGAATN
jgi:hypothetical protein